MIVYMNGHYISEDEAYIPITDRGLLLGDGLFETMLAVDGKVECYSQHHRRFESSAIIMGIPIQKNKFDLSDIIEELLKRNNLQIGYAVIRLTLTRGSSPRGIAIPAVTTPTLIVKAMPYASSDAPVSVVTSSYQTHNISPLCHMKHLGYQVRILAKQEAIEQGFDDALLLNQNNFLVSATCSNVFVIINKRIITPPLKDGCLPGIVRGLLIKLAKNKAILLDVKSLSKSQIPQIESLFLSNSLTGMQPAHRLNNKDIRTDHPLFISLQEAYQEFRQAQQNQCLR